MKKNTAINPSSQPSKKAVKVFNETISRCDQLLLLYHDQILGNNNWILDSSDVLRATLVLAISGFDRYFTSRFSEELVSFLKKNKAKDNLIAILEKAGFNTGQALEMYRMQRPGRRIRKLIDNYLSTYTTQKFHIIDELFVVYGIKNLTKRAAEHTKKKRILNSVSKSIARRHSIVHAADYNEYDKLTKINYRDVVRWVSDIARFVNSCEFIISKVLKN